MTRRAVDIDPAVAAILADGRERTEQRRMTPAQRRTAKRAKRRDRVTLEIDRELMALVREVAEGLGISPAGAINRLLLDGLGRWADGEIEFEGFLKQSRSPRYAWVVEVDGGDLREGIERRLAELA